MSAQYERLTARILHPHDPTPSTEDIFASALETIFTDDTQQSHGVPGQSIIYCSPRFGDVYLQIPIHPDEEAGRLLFAHYLWNAGVIAADAIEQASCDPDEESRGSNGSARDSVGFMTDTTTLGSTTDVGKDTEETKGLMLWDKRYWNVRGTDVLEVGAATALPSLISTLCNARSVMSTDHPSSSAITMNAIEQNFRINIRDRTMTNGIVSSNGSNQNIHREYVNGKMPKLYQPPINTDTQVTVCGYSWGTQTFSDHQEYGIPAANQPKLKSFDRIIIADCLWMLTQHVNLVQTISLYLKAKETDASEAIIQPCALVIAGFHRGRSTVKRFIEIATGSSRGVGEVICRDGDRPEDNDVWATLRATVIFEIDIEGRRRSWEPERPQESKEDLKRWCVCAVLVRR